MAYLLDADACANLSDISHREWLLTNGIGGYAMGTPSGINTRRYHGLLVAAIDPPAERVVLLAAIDAFIQGGAEPIGISTNQYPGAVYPEGHRHIAEFYAGSHIEQRYEAGGMEVVRRLMLHQGKNACTIEYENVGEVPFSLTLRPLVSHKPHHENFRERKDYLEELAFSEGVSRVASGGVQLVIAHPGADRIQVQDWYYRFEHRREAERGLDPHEDLYCPFELAYVLQPGEKVGIGAGTEPDVVPMDVPRREDVAADPLARLKEAASRFVVKTDRRVSIIAGYPWFTDWGRDTMISLPGIFLTRGMCREAREVLRDYSRQCRDGLIPNRFVESGDVPDYNTVDATLWFVNAIYKTLLSEWDLAFAGEMAEVCRSIFEHHVEGTAFGIAVDPEDGLLRQGVPGVQLTWMDAKIGDWVVTPRHGKPVEVNGLWVNALKCMAWVRTKLGLDSEPELEVHRLASKSFESKFWHPGLGHYLDTVDPDDASLRPNQVIAMALPFSPVDPGHAQKALGKVRERLLTPRGLRTLDPESPQYKARFEGDMRQLDAAYHQGTVWPWLLGPYATACVRFGEDPEEAKRVLMGASEMLQDHGFGGISEVYDGDPPQRANGCPWQAWSVAEILRAWTEMEWTP